MSKKIVAVVIASVFLIPLLSFAQTSQTSFTIPSVAVRSIVTSQVTVVAGDTVSGTFSLLNAGHSDASDIYYKISLVGNYQKNTLAGTFYDSTKLTGPLYSKANGSTVIPFTYTLPISVFGTGLGIQIQAFTGAGMPLGWSDEMITVQENKSLNGSSYLSIASANLMLGTSTFNLNAGPILHPGEVPKLSIKFSALPKNNLDIIASIDLYDRSVIGSPIMSTTSAPFILGPSSSKTLSIQLPLPSAAKVYLARVYLRTTQGTQVSAPIDVRYIIQGDIVTIHSLSVDKNAVKAGDAITATVQYTGSPFDIRTGDEYTQGSTTINLILFNERDEMVGQGQGAIDLSGIDNVNTLAVTATLPAKALRGTVIVMKDGVVIAQYSTNLSAQYDVEKELASEQPATQNITPIILIIVLILVVLFFISFMVTKKRRGPGSIMMLLFVISILWAGWASPAQAYWVSSLNFNAPVEISTTRPLGGPSTPIVDGGIIIMSPGSTFFWVTGTFTWAGCVNNGNLSDDFTSTFDDVTSSYHWVPDPSNQFSFGSDGETTPFTVPTDSGDHLLEVKFTNKISSTAGAGFVFTNIILRVTIRASHSLNVSLTATPATINFGGTSALAWTSVNEDRCSAPWTSSTATAGSQDVSPTAPMTAYTMTCTGPGGTDSANATVSVRAPFFSCLAPPTGPNPGSPIATICPGDDLGLTSNVMSTVVTSCTPATKCEFTCVVGYVKNTAGSACIIDTSIHPDLTILPSDLTHPDFRGGTGLDDSLTFFSRIHNDDSVRSAPTIIGFNALFQKATSVGGDNKTDIGISPAFPLSIGGIEPTQFSYSYTLLDIFPWIRVCADNASSSTGLLGVITESNEENNCGGWIQVFTCDPAHLGGRWYPDNSLAGGHCGTPTHYSCTSAPLGTSTIDWQACTGDNPTGSNMPWAWTLGTTTASCPVYPASGACLYYKPLPFTTLTPVTSTIPLDQSQRLTWDSLHTRTCDAKTIGSTTPWTLSVATFGWTFVTPNTRTVYTTSCWNNNGTSTATSTVNVTISCSGTSPNGTNQQPCLGTNTINLSATTIWYNTGPASDSSHCDMSSIPPTNHPNNCLYYTNPTSSGVCYPEVNGAPASFAYVGQLVNWTSVSPGTLFSWYSDSGDHLSDTTTANYPIRYSTIGNKVMWFEVDRPSPSALTQCTTVNASGLPIINNPNFRPL